jgi:hydroxymethylbilane synthase
LPATLPEGLVLGAVLERSIVSDLLLVHPRAVVTRDSFPVKPGSVVGTSSLRRQALLRHFAPQVTSVFLRGNVPTRLEKCKRGDYDAIIVARTGLERLKLNPDPLVAFDLSPGEWLSAPGQGALAVEVRAGDQELIEQLAPLDHAPTRRCVELERRLLVSFGAGCSAPFSAWAELDGAGIFSVHVGLAEEGGAWRSVFLRGHDANQLIEMARLRLSQRETPAGEVRKDICRSARPWY